VSTSSGRLWLYPLGAAGDRVAGGRGAAAPALALRRRRCAVRAAPWSGPYSQRSQPGELVSKQFTQASLREQARVNSELLYEQIQQLDLRRVTIDVDGNVIRTGGKVAWAMRGFNPHPPRTPATSRCSLTRKESRPKCLLSGAP
jgi:hypothetical protein